MKRTKKTGAAAPANFVTVTDSALTKVDADGATITLVKPTAAMAIPELLTNVAPAAAEFNQLVHTMLGSATRAQTLFDDYIFPAIEIFRAWHDTTSAKERKRISPTCNTLTQFKKTLGISDSFDRVRNYRAKKTFGAESLKLLETGNDSANGKDKDSNKDGGSNQPDTKKPDTKKLEDEQREKERLEREQATAKLLQKKAEAEQVLTNATLDLSVATNDANDNPADSDPVELEAAQTKVALAKGNLEVVNDMVAAAKAPTHEAPTDSNTVLSDTTQTMRDTVRETVAKGAEVPADHTVTKTEVAAMIWDVRSAKRGALIIAYTETEAMAMASSLGFAATSCVNVTEPVVAQFDVNGDGLPSTVYLDGGHPTTVKKSVQSETLTDEQVEKVG